MPLLSAQWLLVLSFTALTVFSTSKPQSAIAQTTNSAAPNGLGNQSLYPTPACQKTTVLPATFRAFFIPDELGEPEPGPESTNPIESRLMAMTTQEELQRELDSVRSNYQKWLGDPTAMRTQIRLAQIIHALANQLGLTLLPGECRTFPIPDEMGEPDPGPKSTNPIESRLMAMTTQEDLQQELDSVRSNYQKWLGDPMAMRTQTRLAQIIHALANQLGLTLH